MKGSLKYWVVLLMILWHGGAWGQGTEVVTLGRDVFAFHDELFRQQQIRLEPPAVVDTELFIEMIGIPNVAKINELRIRIRRSSGINNAASIEQRGFRSIVLDPAWTTAVTAGFYLHLGHEAGHQFCQHTVGVGPHTTWCFEDRLTIQYQVQEMLRAERIFEARGIQDELDAYNPLIPDGTNLKATFLIEYTDPDERAVALMRLKGIESCCYIAIGDAVASAIADEDLERENDTKTSAVHFLRFELGADARSFLAAGAPLKLGINHPAYSHSLEVSAETRAALIADLAP